MDVKVAKEVKAVSMGVPIFDAVAVLLLIAISQFSIPMLIGIIFGSVVAVLNFGKGSKSTTRKGTSIYWS